MININIKASEKLNNDFSAFISFDYDNLIVNTLRELPFKFYNKDTTTWEIPTDKVLTIISNLQGFEIKLSGNLSLLNPKPFNLDLPKGFEFKTNPFEHQKFGVQYGLQHDRWFLGDEQGLGKTKQVIDIAVIRKIEMGYKHCLIVCGVNTLKWNWLNEIHTHSNEDAWILGQKTTRKGTIRIGSTKDKLNDLIHLEKYPDDLPYFIITNVESFRDEKISEQISKLCNLGIINMCAADEMHKMKNPQVQQTKGFLKCLSECRIGMTGTPLMNSPLDLYVILKWLGYESHAFYSFKKHYCVMGGYGGYEVVGYKNMEQLTAQINDIMLRRLKSEVLDLPEKTYIDEIVEMETKQSKLYDEIEAGIKNELAMGTLDLTNPLSTLIRLRQCTGYTGIVSDCIFESAKLDRMEDLIEEAVSNNQKVIVFSNWTQMTDIVEQRLNKYNPAVITGETNDSYRQSMVTKFQEDNNCKVIIGTIGAMGTGLTLTAGSVVIFLDEPWNRALFDQAVDRAHRIGAKSNVTIYSIMCKDTVDERIHDIIYKKGVMSDAIIDSGKKLNMQEIFTYLLG
ncbi:MAG: DEAD/DEAH box helicase [Clostridia bacterium]